MSSQNVFGRWLIPIYNDTYVMLFFGLLQRLVSSYLSVNIEKVLHTHCTLSLHYLSVCLSCRLRLCKMIYCVDKVSQSPDYHVICSISHVTGDVESTEPTKMLMRIAEHIDTGPADLREWFMDGKRGVLDLLAQEQGRVQEGKRRADRQTMEAAG